MAVCNLVAINTKIINNADRGSISADAMKSIVTLLLAALITHTVIAADDDFPVYTPHTTSVGPRANKDYPIVDTPNYKGAIVPAHEASRHRYLTNHFHGFWTPTPEQIAKAETRVTAFVD